MTTPKRLHAPTYRHYKPKDLAVVRLNGKDHYLGKFNSPESWERYHRLIAEWHANGHSANEPAQPDPKTGFLGINNVVEAYLDFARGYYSKDGLVRTSDTPSGEAQTRHLGEIPTPSSTRPKTDWRAR